MVVLRLMFGAYFQTCEHCENKVALEEVEKVMNSVSTPPPDVNEGFREN